MQSILPKSMLKTNPNNKDLAELIQFVPLLQVQSGHVLLNPKGMKIIESQVLGNVYLIGLESSQQNILYNFYKNKHISNQHQQERSTSGIWISNFPRYDSETQTQYLYLETSANNNSDRIIIHTICSLICSVILVDMDNKDISYLASGQGRIVFSKYKDNKELRKQEMSHLALYELTKNPINDLRGDHNAIYQYLTEKKVYIEAESLYKSLSMLRLAADRLENQDWEYVNRIEEELKYMCNTEPQKSQELLRGPLIRWYLEKVRQNINSGQGVVEIERCLDLEVTDGYNAFTIGRDAYKYRMERSMKQEGVPNIHEVLNIAREEAIDEFRKHSEDAEYIVYLNDFIDMKERRIIQENNKIFQLQNINFLQEESQKLIDKVSRQKLDQVSANKQIELLAQNYKATQHGDSKYELLSQCLKYLNATVSKMVSDRDNRRMKKQLQSYNEEKAQLQQRIKQLQSKDKEKDKKGGCCSSCEIM